MADQPPPSTAAIAIATAIIAGLGGYFIGQGSALGIFGARLSTAGGGIRTRDQKDVGQNLASSDEGEEKDGSNDDEPEEQEGLRGFEDEGGECKLTLVVRTDLGMTKGKIAAQCSHATLACYKSLLHSLAPSQALLRRWERQGQAKVALQVKSEDEVELLQAQAVSLGLCAQVVHDAGRTQIASGSATVLGVGPGPKAVVDQVTGGLKLL